MTRRSALAGLSAPVTDGAAADHSALTLTGRPAVLLRLWARADDGDFSRAVRGTTGLELPYAPNTTVAHAGRCLLWLSPAQWLLTCEEQSAISETELQAALLGTTGTVVDVSHAYAVVTISGKHARDVLAKGVPIDLDTQAFDAGACAQTCLAEMNVLVHARAARVMDLYVGRSYTVSLWEWLCASGAEFDHRP